MSHSMSQVLVAGEDNAANTMMQYIGAVNAVAGFKRYKPLTAEAAINAAPDLILATNQGLKAAGGIHGLLRLPGLTQTEAGKQRRVVSMDALLLLGMGPRLPQSVAELAQKCTETLAGKVFTA